MPPKKQSKRVKEPLREVPDREEIIQEVLKRFERKSNKLVTAQDRNLNRNKLFLVNEDFEGLRIFNGGVEVGDFGPFNGTIPEPIQVGNELASPNLQHVLEIVDIIHTINNSRDGRTKTFIILRPLN